MIVPVSSVIDLYMTIFAWFMYDAMWSVITGTGLVILPFLAKVISIIMADAEKDKSQKSVGQFVKTIEFNIYSMIVVMIFCAMPSINLNLQNMQYTHLACMVDDDLSDIRRTAEELTYANTGTSADRAGQSFLASLNGESVQIPLWWYIFGKLSHAFTFSMSFELPCNLNLSTMVDGLNEAKISNNEPLKREVAQFHKECWIPATRAYVRDSNQRDFEVPSGLANNPQVDLSWIGSNIYMNMAGYYDSFRAETPVAEYFWVESRDEVMTTQEAAGDRGFPFCDEWWEPDNTTIAGLRARLLEHLKTDPRYAEDCDICWGSTWRYYADRFLGTDLQRVKDDTLLRIVLSSDEEMTREFSKTLSRGGLTEWITGWGASAGIFKATATNLVESRVYKSGAPIVQATVLLGFVMFLPLLMSFSQFNIASVMTLTLLFFSIIFWSYLFVFAEYFQNYFYESMHAAYYDQSFSSGDMYTVDNDLTLRILRWIGRMGYIVFPALFTFLLGAVGFKAGSGVEGLLNSRATTAPAASAGAQSVGMAKSLVTKGKSFAKK